MWAADIMYPTIDGVSFDSAPSINHAPLAGLFYLCFIICGSFFVLNLFVGVVIANFNQVNQQEEENGGVWAPVGALLRGSHWWMTK